MLGIILSGAGIFSILSHFYADKSPESRMLFWGENPFAIKDDHKEAYTVKVTDRLFIVLAMLGMFIQAVVSIFDTKLDNNHSLKYYWVFFAIILLVVLVIVLLILRLGKWLAMRKCIPEIISNQMEVYKHVVDIVKNDGWRIDQLSQKDQINDPKKYRDANFKVALEHVDQIEKLLELKPIEGNLDCRIMAVI